MDRRAFLQGLVALAACDTGSASVPASSSSASRCDGPPAADRGEGTPIAFADESEQVKDTPVGAGLDGRLYTNLRTAVAGCSALTIPSEHFYIRTRVPDRIDYATPWRIRGDVDLAATDLNLRARPMGATLLECSGNARGGSFGLMSVATWHGVPLIDVLPPASSTTGRRVLVSGFDDHSQPSERSVPGASWIFSRADLEKTGAFLATQMNDAPLPVDHGAPVRLVVPGWYGCTCIKWVDRISLVSDDEPSTAHMREFASRTHQNGEPTLAREFLPASIDLTAMPIDLVMNANTAELLFRGVFWGGETNDDDVNLELMLFESGREVLRVPVAICCTRSSTRTWGLWSATAPLQRKGSYDVALRSVLPVKTRRLDSRYYLRTFAII